MAEADDEMRPVRSGSIFAFGFHGDGVSARLEGDLYLYRRAIGPMHGWSAGFRISRSCFLSERRDNLWSAIPDLGLAGIEKGSLEI